MTRRSRAARHALTLAGTPTAAFTSADVGKTVMIAGAGAAGIDLITTISAYVSASHVTTTAAASATVSGVEAIYGTSDTAAWQAVFDSVTSAGAQIIAPPTASLVPSGGLTCAEPFAFAGTYAFFSAGVGISGSMLVQLTDSGSLLTTTGAGTKIENVGFFHRSGGGASHRGSTLIGVNMTSNHFGRVENCFIFGWSTGLKVLTSIEFAARDLTMQRLRAPLRRRSLHRYAR